MLDLPVGVMLGLIGLVALLAVGRGVMQGSIPVFFTKRPDIVRAEEPLRFWTQVVGVSVAAAIVLLIAAVLLT